MRKYLLPLAILSAIGAVVVVLVLQGRSEGPQPHKAGEAPPPPGPAIPESVTPIREKLARPPTPTSVAENADLSDLELFAAKGDAEKVRIFRARVCDNIDLIVESPKLAADLMETIRRYGAESDNEEMRDALLPILRVLPLPEATKMIEEQYFQARNAEERKFLLEAMSHSYHNPERAGLIAVERALNAPTDEERYHAFDVIRNFSGSNDVTFRTAKAIYEGTTRPEQTSLVLETVSRFAYQSPDAAKWMKERLQRVRIEEIQDVLSKIESWGDERDAAFLESLASEFPELGDMLRMKAENLRLVLKDRERATQRVGTE